jgi:hypothetical protein
MMDIRLPGFLYPSLLRPEISLSALEDTHGLGVSGFGPQADGLHFVKCTCENIPPLGFRVLVGGRAEDQVVQ